MMVNYVKLEKSSVVWVVDVDVDVDGLSRVTTDKDTRLVNGCGPPENILRNSFSFFI